MECFLVQQNCQPHTVCYHPQSEGYVLTGVCLSTGGAYVVGACMVGGHAWQGGVHGRGVCMAGGSMTGGHAWQWGMRAMHPWQILWLWHTVNEWAVRIPLECILVVIRSTQFGSQH